MKPAHCAPWLIGVVTFVLAFLVIPPPATAGNPPPTLTILLTNDDGYEAPGLRAMARALAPLGKLVVAAPLENQSGMGHATTVRQFVLVRPYEILPGIESYAIQARPATCARLALESLLPEKPDLVVSGINRGMNLGIVTYYSGTVAAAREAAFLGIPALAVSMQGNDEDDYARTAAFVAQLVADLHAQGRLRPGLFLNINAPTGERRGVRVTRQSTTPTPQLFERYTNPRGELYFWSDYRSLGEDEEGTDVWAVAERLISITPLRINQTHTPDFDWLEKLERLAAPAAP
jgi:5'-nucleotidase